MPYCRHFEWCLLTETKSYKLNTFNGLKAFSLSVALFVICIKQIGNALSAGFLFITDRNHDCNSEMIVRFFFK
jgi:hypothetical protein